MRSLLPATPTAAAVALAAALAGCSTSSAPHVATLQTSAAAAPTSSGGTQDYDALMVQYAHCMRAHGVEDYPDPVQQPGHSGLSLQYGGNTTAAPYQAADDACKHFIAPLVALKQDAAHDAVSATKLQALTAYARCMRGRRIPMLDPDPNDGHISLGRVPDTDDSIGRSSPQFHAADTACRSQLPAGTNDDGTGPP